MAGTFSQLEVCQSLKYLTSTNKCLEQGCDRVVDSLAVKLLSTCVVLAEELNCLLVEQFVLLLNLQVDCVARTGCEQLQFTYKSGSLPSFIVLVRCAISSGSVGIII